MYTYRFVKLFKLIFLNKEKFKAPKFKRLSDKTKSPQIQKHTICKEPLGENKRFGESKKESHAAST